MRWRWGVRGAWFHKRMDALGVSLWSQPGKEMVSLDLTWKTNDLSRAAKGVFFLRQFRQEMRAD